MSAQQAPRLASAARAGTFTRHSSQLTSLFTGGRRSIMPVFSQSPSIPTSSNAAANDREKGSAAAAAAASMGQAPSLPLGNGGSMHGGSMHLLSAGSPPHSGGVGLGGGGAGARPASTDLPASLELPYNRYEDSGPHSVTWARGGGPPRWPP